MGASSSVSESSTSSQSYKNDAHNVKLVSESGTSGVPHSTTSSKAQEEKSTSSKETSEFRGNPELKRLVVAMQSEVIELEQRLSQVSTEADSSRRELNVAFAFFFFCLLTTRLFLLSILFGILLDKILLRCSEQ